MELYPFIKEPEPETDSTLSGGGGSGKEVGIETTDEVLGGCIGLTLYSNKDCTSGNCKMGLIFVGNAAVVVVEPEELALFHIPG